MSEPLPLSENVPDLQYLEVRRFPGGRVAAIEALLYGAHIVAARSEEDWRYGWSEEWSYESLAQAVLALAQWDGTGDPDGWVRHVPSYRRRPGGDVSQEYVEP